MHSHAHARVMASCSCKGDCKCDGVACARLSRLGPRIHWYRLSHAALVAALEDVHDALCAIGHMHMHVHGRCLHPRPGLEPQGSSSTFHKRHAHAYGRRHAYVTSLCKGTHATAVRGTSAEAKLTVFNASAAAATGFEGDKRTQLFEFNDIDHDCDHRCVRRLVGIYRSRSDCHECYQLPEHEI